MGYNPETGEQTVEPGDEEVVETSGGEAEGEAAAEEPEGQAEEAAKEGEEAAEGEESGEEGEAPQPGSQAKGGYTPNLTFKVHNKVQNFPAWAKAVVKDQKSEKEIRELLEKANGLPFVKQRADNFKSQLEQVAPAYEKLANFFTDSKELRDDKDFDALFEKWQISVADVAEWLKEKIETRNLPEKERRVYDSERTNRRQVREALKERGSLEQQVYQQAVDLKRIQFDRELARPEIAEILQNYDSTVGEEGAFFNLVVDHAIARSVQDGVDLTPQQAVSDVLKRVKPFLAQAAAESGGGGGQLPALNPKQPLKKPATLPRVGATNTSPVKRQPRSIADLKKLRDESIAASSQD